MTSAICVNGGTSRANIVKAVAEIMMITLRKKVIGMKCENCIHYGVCVVNSYCHEPCGYYEEERPQWIPCSDMLPKENICDDGYVEPSDYVLVFGDHGQYGVSRYWGNRRTKKTNPHSFSDWMDLEWFSQKPIAWMPLPKPYQKEGEENE